MNYCSYCGAKINPEQDICLKCGKIINNNTAKSEKEHDNDNTGLIIICALTGLILPIVGSILYYVLKNSNSKCARVANICSWIGFAPYFVIIIEWIILAQ